MRPTVEKRQLGIYWLPNSLTILALVCGIYSIVLGFQGKFSMACMLILGASALDVMDGFVAKITNNVSEFGAHLDSLSDIVSFGVAPALLVWLWSGDILGNSALLATCLYVAMTALRLARYNTQLTDKEEKSYFQGLPSPAGSALVFGFIWVCDTYSWDGIIAHWLLFSVCVFSALLMVSNIRYLGVKHLGKRRVPFVGLLALFIAFIVIISQPPLAIWSIAMGYAVFGIIYTLFLRRQRRIQRKLQNSHKKTA